MDDDEPGHHLRADQLQLVTLSRFQRRESTPMGTNLSHPTTGGVPEGNGMIITTTTTTTTSHIGGNVANSTTSNSFDGTLLPATHPSFAAPHMLGAPRLSTTGEPMFTGFQPNPDLLPGPPRRDLMLIEKDGSMVPFTCDACLDVRQLPFRAPPTVVGRTVDDLHDEHCDAARIRTSRQQILDVIRNFVHLQIEQHTPPTVQCIETLLGQAWSCGMMLARQLKSSLVWIRTPRLARGVEAGGD